MSAPDKIYMPNELLSEEWQRHIEGEDTCYIRKDYLLELIEEESGLWNEGRTIFSRLVNKLNEL